MDQAADLSIVLSNEMGEEVVIGYDKGANQFFIDRSKSGKVDFHKDFAARHTAPRFTSSSKMDMTLVIDVASVEMFADDGLSVMTEIFFPNKPYSKINIQSANGAVIKKLDYAKLNGTLK
jgi:fructan beta-fructosidase